MLRPYNIHEKYYIIPPDTTILNKQAVYPPSPWKEQAV